MKVLLIIAIIIFLLLTFLLIIFSRHGLFADVKITEKIVGPYILLYKKHVGDYKNVGLIMDKIYYDLKDNYHIETTKGFGLYYDNPQNVAKEECRSIVGCIIENKSINDLTNLKNKYGVKEYPASKSVIAEFPYKGKLSIFIGIFKVYPKLSTFIEKQKYPKTPIMEIYDQPNKTIDYISSIELSKEIFDSLLLLDEEK